MNRNDSGESLLEKWSIAIKFAWLSDIADIFALLCSFLLTIASVVLVLVIFHTQATYAELAPIPTHTLSILQRIISALSVPVASGVVMVAGKRYVLFKPTRGGIRSQRVAVYASPSTSNLAGYLVWHTFELPALVLLAVWALGLATGFTINDAWAMAPNVFTLTSVQVPFGPLKAPVESLLVPALGQLSYVMGSVCSGIAGNAGLIKIGGLQLASGLPMGILYYPLLPFPGPNTVFSFSTSLNGFNISVEPLSSIPPTAQNLTCAGTIGNFTTGQLWYESGDTQTLTVVGNATFLPPQLYRINASAIVLDGTLQSKGNGTEFVPNGTTRSNVMPDDRWAQDIVSLVCNATHPLSAGCSYEASLIDFATTLLEWPYSNGTVIDPLTAGGMYWSTALGMAMGAYSSAWYPMIGTKQVITYTDYDAVFFKARYGVYVLIANIVVSAIMLVVVVRLRMASRLGGDFINGTRLLLDPLRKPELFYANLDTTVDALGNPYMLVSENN